ncbi:hypothetical protein [Arenibaculum pallidiluteum]|uniref:hypothetical protein n=1 Tax=Arenibaculum pallidiluteum TaxID=2812559 RepID=UPI001A9639B8|nr:hypothetical protein [Arenibaculum pallidiluteum]
MAELPTGAVTVVYELHTLQDRFWRLAADANSQDRLMQAAEQSLLNQSGVQGVRVVRSSHFHGFEHSDRVVLHKWLRAGAEEPDFDHHGPSAASTAACTAPADFYREDARAEMRILLARFLEARRITPVELLHFPGHAEEMAANRAVVEAAVQKAARAQVTGTATPANRRHHDLMELTHKAVHELASEARANPFVAIEPAGFMAAAREVAARFPDRPEFHVLRLLAGCLADSATWTEKLHRIGLAAGADGIEIPELKPIDMVAAEMMRTPSALRELAGERGTLQAVLKFLMDLHGGRVGAVLGVPGEAGGAESLGPLIAAGLMPRTRSALRLSLLEELGRPAWLRPAGDLFQEMEALNVVIAGMTEASPALGRDEEVREAVEQRCGRAIASERLAIALQGARTTFEKLERLVRLIQLAPGERNKAQLRAVLVQSVSPRMLLHELMPARAQRVEAAEHLGAALALLGAGGVEGKAASPVAGPIEEELLDILRSEVVGSKRPLPDRIDLLVRMLGKAPPPEGRVRTFAAGILTRALSVPDFLPAYRQRFVREEREALQRLQRFAAAVGASPAGA